MQAHVPEQREIDTVSEIIEVYNKYAVEKWQHVLDPLARLWLSFTEVGSNDQKATSRAPVAALRYRDSYDLTGISQLLKLMKGSECAKIQ